MVECKGAGVRRMLFILHSIAGAFPAVAESGRGPRRAVCGGRVTIRPDKCSTATSPPD